jgi:hypothetical protein
MTAASRNCCNKHNNACPANNAPAVALGEVRGGLMVGMEMVLDRG